MHPLRFAILVAALLIPARAFSAPIVDLTFRTVTDTESISFGLAPFSWSGPLGDAAGISFDSGSIQLVSGPLLSLTVDAASQRTVYAYGPGTLLIEAFWGSQHGTFTASTQPFSIRVCEGCDTLFGGSLADDFAIPLGLGVFNAAFAQALGVSPHTSGGFADFGLEAISGNPASLTRAAFDHRGSAAVTVPASVPEPNLLLLTASGAIWWIAGRRRRVIRARREAHSRT